MVRRKTVRESQNITYAVVRGVVNRLALIFSAGSETNRA